MIKRFLMLAAVAGALCFPAAVTAAKGTDVVRGPACGDITLSPDYTFDTADQTSATVSATIATAAPSCKKATYTVYVYDATGTSQLDSCSYAGDGVTSQFGPCNTYTSPRGDPLCLYATSTGDDGHIIDTAPNEGCADFGEPVTPGPVGATGFH